MSFHSRLTLKVVTMVLRGAWFQRFGAAGCVFLIRRVLSSDTAKSMHRVFGALCLMQGIRLHAGANVINAI